MKKTCINIGISVLGACLIYLATRLNIPVPGTDILLSAQTLVIIVIATLFPRYLGVLAVCFYLFAGLFGIPVFSNAGHGLEHLLGPTGGYLLGFLVAAFFIAKVKNTHYFQQPTNLYLIMLVAHCIILFHGWIWLSKFVGIVSAFEQGVSPFIVGGLAKSLIASIIILIVNTINKHSNDKNII